MSTFLINLDTAANKYGVWILTIENGKVSFTQKTLNQNASFDSSYKLAPIGGYLMAWGSSQGSGSQKNFPYRLFEFDEYSDDPLNSAPLQTGSWPVNKFWSYRQYYSSNPDEQNELNLIPLVGNFMLFFVPGEGRGTYELWNFDPNFLNPVSSHTPSSDTENMNSNDPLPAPYTAQGGFPAIQSGHELIPVGNYVLDRSSDGTSFRVWSIDPQDMVPLSIYEVQYGSMKGIDQRHQMTVIGDQIMTWIPGEASFCLWQFDPKEKNPLSRLVCEGAFPFDTSDCRLLSIQTRAAINLKPAPGSLDYMRSKIKHIVYYMLESRSFDNVCGWLYDKNRKDLNFIGSDKPFEGASTDYYNMDGNTKVYVSLFNDGKLSNDIVLSDQSQDPFHDNSDALLQMFYNYNPGYARKAKPDMGGFVKNNANHQVMLSFSPEQLPILNGLAENFAISDEWFSSVPGGTDINRAFSVSGSGLNRLDTWEGGRPYQLWPQFPHRQSLWKVLWNNGIRDWKIYNAILWDNHPFTYHIYLEGQIPSVDALIQQQSGQYSAYDSGNFLDSVENFKIQARNGTLPAFSFLEPVWISPTGTSSYHPGAGLVPAETTLNDIYESVKNGPHWNETLLVITFSKNGGIYDHVSPPYATKPWSNDGLNGFYFDLMGPRVPAILVSPWIKKNTVFRSGSDTPYDATSFAATLLNWFGIPKSRWGLGDRVYQAPTFENVFQESEARKDAPELQPPYDKNFPRN